MTSDTRSPAEIEREIERERSGLADTLNDLQDRFSVESIARQFSDQFRENGGEISRSVADAVKRNPVALALTGIGIAWMVFGDKSPIASGGSYDRRDDAIPQDRNLERQRKEAREQRFTSRRETRDYGDNRRIAESTYGTGDMPSWARAATEPGDYGRSGSAKGTTHYSGDASSRAPAGTSDDKEGVMSGAASAVSEGGQRAASGAASGASAAASAVSGAARSVADGANRAAGATGEGISDMRTRLAQGTEALSEEARERVIAARERALDAWHGMGDYTQRGRERTADLFDEYPLIAGALAVAAGAAVAAALPRSQSEDHYFGKARDDIFEEAERIYHEESQKVAKVADAATNEALKVAREVKSDADAAAPSAAEAVTEKAKEAGNRVTDAAKSEAEKQNLGSVKS
ncbi:DUF3618 domain-containing protein [Sulfitobacter sp. BDSS02]|nr:DUF3618 domain-containing protein [Sulfitobacter sp. BDSS02]MBR9850495.1 DUF3618 domain-containing protein [Paracoccaceae bacterium]